MPESLREGTLLVVEAGPHDRQNVIVTADCGGGCECESGHTLYESDETGKVGAPVVCQCEAGCGCEDDDCDCDSDDVGCSQLTWIVPSLKAGERKYYVTAPAKDSCGCGCGCDESGVAINLIQDEKADIVINGQLFTSYVVKEGIARPYCYPVIGPGGAEVTNFAPGDHVHHKSMYVAQGDVNGCDNWSELAGHASTVNQELIALSQGPVYGELFSISDWVSASGEKILEEFTSITVYNLPDNGRIMDWDITLAASYQGVHFGDTKEAGTLSIRVAESMEVPNGGTIRNSYGGVNDDENWGKRAQWVDYYGPVASGVAGITVMDTPGNLRYPTYWHVRGYGLFTANCWGIHDFTGDHSKRGDYVLKAGDELNFRYRVYIHEGDTCKAGVKGKYLDYIFPPKVSVVSK
jgi:hypothetical protein